MTENFILGGLFDDSSEQAGTDSERQVQDPVSGFGAGNGFVIRPVD